MRPLADMTVQERADTVGMWADVATEGCRAIIVHTFLCCDGPYAQMFAPEIEDYYPTPIDTITPRPDLPRAWNPDGTPPAGKWEYAEHLSKGVTTVYLCGKENPTRRRWVGEWEEV